MVVPIFVRLTESTQLPLSSCGHTQRVHFPECLEAVICLGHSLSSPQLCLTFLASHPKLL